MEANCVRVLLVDDHKLLLESLATCLANTPGVAVAGTLRSADGLLEAVDAAKPDVVVMDLNLPGRGAFAAVEELRMARPGVRVLFLTAFLADAFVAQALQARVEGYLLKSTPVQELVDAVLRIAAGDVVYGVEVQDRIHFDPSTRRYASRSEHELSGLTGRQIEVLRHLARGASVKEIATQFLMSQKSVESHKYRIMHRLGIHDRVQLALYAVREGLIVP
jgi:DNA-binding NarL/FixJ family response regulator